MALRVAALLASAENGGRVELRHWARAQEAVERHLHCPGPWGSPQDPQGAQAQVWRLYAHRLYEQVTELDVSPQAEIEAKVVDAVSRHLHCPGPWGSPQDPQGAQAQVWQGTEKYPGGLTAADIARFLRGLGAGEVRFHADQMVAAGVLASHKRGRAVRYYLPAAEGLVDSRQRDNRQRVKIVSAAGHGGGKADEQ
jgi:hypothetical protein